MHKSSIVALFFFILFSTPNTLAQHTLEKVDFSRLEVNSGLSNSNVRSIYQDSKGYMWIGTEDGLNRYDGYSFKMYRRNEHDTASLLKNCINRIFEDSRGKLWVATRGGGLHYYDRKLDRFMRVKEFSYHCEINALMEDSDKNLWVAGTRSSKAFTARFDYLTKKWTYYNLFDSSEPISAMIQASEHEFWIGVRRTGLFKWNAKQNKVKALLPDKNTISVHIDIRNVVKDNQGVLWLATTEGLIKFDINSGQYTNFSKNTTPSLPVNTIQDICLDGNYLWVATENGGLSRFDRLHNTITNFSVDKNDPHSISDNSIWSLYRDHQGRIWVGTFSKGLCIIDSMKDKFSELNISLKNDVVNAIWQDHKNRLWIGTEGGLAMKDRNKVTYYQHEPGRKGSLSSNPVLSIFEDHKGQLWFGTWGGGLNKYDDKNDRFIHYLPDVKNEKSLSDSNIYAIKEYLPKGELLVGSYNGLNVLKDEQKGIFKRYRDPYLESNNYLRTLYQDSHGNLWLGSIAALNMFAIEEINNTMFNFSKDSISYDLFINCILEDRRGNLWVGTNNGLQELTKKKYVATYTVRDGLPGNIVNGILEDDQQNLWLSTTLGISKFNPEKKTFQNFDVDDGLLSNDFKPNSCFKNDDGLFFFGSSKGVNVFRPAQIKFNPFIPPVYLTDLKIFNHSIKIGEMDSLLREDISQTKEITLPEKFNFFSIDFVALNFSSSNKNQYAYRLDGFDNDWIQIGNQRSAKFTNLDAGTYTFRVKASNNDGLWNDTGVTLIIHILPPWWKTWWAKSITLLMLIMTVIGIYKFRIRTINKQNIMLGTLVTLRTAELQRANEELLSNKSEIEVQNNLLITQREELLAQNEALVESKKRQLELYTQGIIEKSEIITQIMAELEQAKKKPLSHTLQIEKFNQVLHTRILTDDDWENFKKIFTDVHPNFFGALRYLFPDITTSELRLSALIKLNLSTKEAADTLGISIDSVKKSRYRLKKKLLLQEDESLEDFIRKLI